MSKAKPTYTQVVDSLSDLIGAFSDIDALLDNYMSQCDASKKESRASKDANRVHARAITIAAAAFTGRSRDAAAFAALSRLVREISESSGPDAYEGMAEAIRVLGD